MMIYELKIKLLDVGTDVERVIHIHRDSDFNDLEALIHILFDWTQRHLGVYHVNVTNGKQIGNVHITNQRINQTLMNSNKYTYTLYETTLRDWLEKPKDKLTYVCNEGNHWHHEIELIKEMKADEQIEYPECVRVSNYAPPEHGHFDITKDEIGLIANAEENNIIRDVVNDNIYFNMILDEDDENVDEPVKEELDGSNRFQPLTQDEAASKVWEATLKKAKEFLQAKPWQTLTDHDIFAIIDPSSGRYLFCRVVGYDQVQYGLEIYLDIDGFFGLLSLLAEEEITLDGLQQEHILLLTFEDRDKLSNMDYHLIKTYSTTFHGKKSWPEFISFEPGYFPWTMNEDEASLVRFVMSQILIMQDEVDKGLIIPSVLEEQMILVRHMGEENIYENRFSDVEDLLEAEEEKELILSELEIKRFSKLHKTLPVEIEFAIQPIGVPVQTAENERPFYVTLIVGIDVEDGNIIYQDTLDQPPHLYTMQQSFLAAMMYMGGMPSMMYTDAYTARAILPFLDVHEFEVQIEEHLEVVPMLVEGLTEHLKSQLEE